MRSTFVCVLTLFICNLSIELSKRPPPTSHEQTFDDDSSLLAPIEVGALTLFPIVANDPSHADDVLALDEAMASHELRIREVDGGRVDDPAGSDPQRLRRTDEETRLHCERSLHPGYIGNTSAWNECRGASGLR